jgi:hypothetical protein
VTDIINIVAAWLNRNSAAVLLASFVTFVVITVIYLISTWRLRHVVKRYQTLLNELNQRSVETLLFDQVETMRVTKATVDQFKERLSNLELAAQSYVQRVGVVRFNAFADTGSDLSFSIALLDNNDDGVVISCIQGRHEGRTYAKPITRGRSAYPLSQEELLAIQKTHGQVDQTTSAEGKAASAGE